MAIIIAASVQLQTEAQEAVSQLIQAGFAPEKVTSFFVNPPGQHATYPIGGDRYQSPGVTDKPGKSAKVVGVITKVAEAVIGVAHDDSHVVDPNKATNTSVSGSVANHAHRVAIRRANMLVAVELIDQAHEDKVVALLLQLGAIGVERAEGKIVDGEWGDFDPLSEPHYL